MEEWGWSPQNIINRKKLTAEQRKKSKLKQDVGKLNQPPIYYWVEINDIKNWGFVVICINEKRNALSKYKINKQKHKNVQTRINSTSNAWNK